MGTQHSERRMVADRFRRIWAVTNEIAAAPGHTRAELAGIFHLSERQVQSDLNIIRRDMRLPLVRRSGYRFVSEGGAVDGAGSLSMQEGQLLVLVCTRALKDRTIPREQLAATVRKLPSLFAPHVQPLIGRMVEAMTGTAGREQQVILALIDAALRQAWVRLHSPNYETTVRPEVIVPYLDSWYVIGERQTDGRSRMWDLNDVTAVTLAADVAQGVGF